MIDDRSGRRVSSGRTIEHLLDRRELRIARAAGLVERRDDPGCTDLVLQPSVQPVPGVERIADQRQIADLARGAVGAPDQLVADDDPHADARADRDEDHRRDAAC